MVESLDAVSTPSRASPGASCSARSRRATGPCDTAGGRHTFDSVIEELVEHERITLAPPLDTQSVDAGWGQALRKLQALYDNNRINQSGHSRE